MMGEDVRSYSFCTRSRFGAIVFAFPFGERVMYEDDDPWPFKCPECGEEFTKEIGWLKAQTPTIAVKCPGILNPLGPILCPVTLHYSAKEFRLALAKAKAGRYDPFGAHWVRKKRL
jgi:hypothetical protein